MSNGGTIPSNAEVHLWLEAALAAVSDAAVGADALCEVQFVNPAAEALLGLSNGALLGRKAAEAIRVFEHGTGRELANPLVESLRLQAPVKTAPTSCLRGAGGREILLEGTATPVRSQQGELRGAVFVFRDLAARRQLEARLRQVQKIEVVGQLRGGIAHDFNNLMTIILGFSELLQTRAGKQASHADWREPLQEIKSAAEKATLLTQQILSLGRRHVSQAGLINLNDLVLSMQKMLGRILGETVRVQSQLDGNVPLVMADPVKIQQAILHLTVNAREAMPRGGDLLIQTSRRQGENGPRDFMAELSVADSGEGMKAETLSKARELYFTTKEGAKGMGLPAVDGIAQEFGGTFRLESEPGRGTKAILTLPASETQPAPAALASQSYARTSGREAILLVEDADRVRRLLVRVLEEAGYTVFQAANGRAGLELCKQHEGKIHLVVTDVIMPEMSGPELVRAIAGMKQQPRVLFLSGHTGDELQRQGINQSDYHFLQKPFLGDALLKKVREVLGEESRQHTVDSRQ
jgi:PAS domain S-box-containing protein